MREYGSGMLVGMAILNANPQAIITHDAYRSTFEKIWKNVTYKNFCEPFE